MPESQGERHRFFLEVVSVDVDPVVDQLALFLVEHRRLGWEVGNEDEAKESGNAGEDAHHDLCEVGSDRLREPGKTHEDPRPTGNPAKTRHGREAVGDDVAETAESLTAKVEAGNAPLRFVSRVPAGDEEDAAREQEAFESAEEHAQADQSCPRFGETEAFPKSDASRRAQISTHRS